MSTQGNQRSRYAATGGHGERLETYTKWGHQACDRYQAMRTASQQAAFFLPYLRPGMKVLDCGCGPGSITIGLAEMVAPGDVWGIDLDLAALAKARNDAAAKGLANIHFKHGSVYALPYPDHSFDAVFSHAVLEHVGEPVAMLREMHRVTKPGGIIGVRTPDRDGLLLAPTNDTLDQYRSRLRQWHALNGTDFQRGKLLRGRLRQAGFSDIQATASYESYATPVATQFVASLLISTLYKDKERWIEAGLADAATIKAWAAALQSWAVDPDAFIAIAWGEAVARKV